MSIDDATDELDSKKREHVPTLLGMSHHQVQELSMSQIVQALQKRYKEVGLTPIQKYIIDVGHGVYDGYRYNSKELSRILKISQSEIETQHDQALKQLGIRAY